MFYWQSAHIVKKMSERYYSINRFTQICLTQANLRAKNVCFPLWGIDGAVTRQTGCMFPVFESARSNQGRDPSNLVSGKFACVGHKCPKTIHFHANLRDVAHICVKDTTCLCTYGETLFNVQLRQIRIFAYNSIGVKDRKKSQSSKLKENFNTHILNLFSTSYAKY